MRDVRIRVSVYGGLLFYLFLKLGHWYRLTLMVLHAIQRCFWGMGLLMLLFRLLAAFALSRCQQ